jgi:hypothetical protein
MITDDRSKTKVSFSLYYLYDIINDRPMVYQNDTTYNHYQNLKKIEKSDL